jgi:hypothetical protein
MAFGPALGHNKLLVTTSGHSKLIKLIGRAGHTNSLVNSIGRIGPKTQTQLIVKLSSATNSDGTQVQEVRCCYSKNIPSFLQKLQNIL